MKEVNTVKGEEEFQEFFPTDLEIASNHLSNAFLL